MEVQEFVSLASYTTLKIGGFARYFCDVHSLAELTEAITFAREKHLPTLVLGGGSNMLVSDSGFPGVVLHSIVSGIEWEENGGTLFVTVGAGVVWDDLVAQSTAKGYWGLENLSGIPGSVGASAIQNIGAYGTEVSEVIEWVECYDSAMAVVRKIDHEDCLFGYRDSIWKHDSGKGLIVLRIRFRLKKEGVAQLSYKDLNEYFARVKKNQPTQEEVRSAVLEIRSGKFPDLARYGTAGSFFKHPIVTKEEGEQFLAKFPDAPHYAMGGGRMKLSAGWIIDHALSLRGMRKGNVGTWEKQALVLVNYGGASAKEVRAFAREIQYRAAVHTNILLEPEVVFVESE